MAIYNIYTDGACFPNPGPGSWGYVRLNKEFVFINESTNLVLSKTTNNRMEYQACIEALKTCLSEDEVTIYSDSMLLVRQINEQTRKIKANLDLVNEIMNHKRRLKMCSAKWVKGHSGDKWNEYVDELCSLSLSILYKSNQFSNFAFFPE